MENPVDSALFRLLLNRAARASVQYQVNSFVGVCQAHQFRFSQILRALSNYAQGESGKVPSERDTWETIAVLLDEAALLAEQSGQELP